MIAARLGLEDERLLLGAAATEKAVKSVAGPLVLHLATHGYFLPDLPLPRRVRPWEDLLETRAAESRDDPLLRSVVALAGFSERRLAPDADDGVLTALEASMLDLVGTEVVVLSACETAIGESRAGQGVFGLRRALAVAGARSQLTTLWRVADHPTRWLMEHWYALLKQGHGRAEALRLAQLAYLHGELPTVAGTTRGARPRSADFALRHPNYWAGFVLIGEVGPIRAWL